MKILSISNFTTKLLSIKDYFLNTTQIERSLRSLLRSLIVKLLKDNIFIERLGLNSSQAIVSTAAPLTFFLAAAAALFVQK